MELRYKILIEKNEEGGYTVTVPLLPGCITQGDT
ncbi:MAG TPA: type II toxin-antitoxin system HicB family antitoxin, partial [Euryarchaeota archaeon]|nr:type II toxin-antitoxin system HicB family antitoxin [Euryarchaeota archaeon]